MHLSSCILLKAVRVGKATLKLAVYRNVSYFHMLLGRSTFQWKRPVSQSCLTASALSLLFVILFIYLLFFAVFLWLSLCSAAVTGRCHAVLIARWMLQGGAFIYRDVFNGSWQLNGQSTYQEEVKALCTATTTYICAKAILLHPTFRVLWLTSVQELKLLLTASLW